MLQHQIQPQRQVIKTNDCCEFQQTIDTIGRLEESGHDCGRVCMAGEDLQVPDGLVEGHNGFLGVV